MFTEKEIAESLGGTVSTMTGSRYKVRLIEADRLGSTGYYPASTLRTYGPKVFVKGTPMFLNHLSASEKKDRPHGSVHDFAAELAEDAYFVEGDGLYAEVEVFEHHQPLIRSLKDKIGVSIRARGHVTEEVVNGQTVPVFKDFLLARSADFVVKPGAGGRIVEMLEEASIDTDSESASEEQERENMDELEKRFDAFEKSLPGLIKDAVEAAIPAAVVTPVVEAKEEDALEIAEALANSTLSVEGRKRVLDLHRANGEDLAKLIEAEEAYVKKTVVADDAEGVEDAEESANDADAKPFTLPTRWATKKVN